MNKNKFIKEHFKEPTKLQVKNAWSKQQAILGLQKMLQTMPRGSTREIIAWDKVFTTLAKMAGWFTADTTINTANNLIFVSRAENKEAWELQAKHQQNELRLKTKMATDTRINTRNSS